MNIINFVGGVGGASWTGFCGVPVEVMLLLSLPLLLSVRHFRPSFC